MTTSPPHASRSKPPLIEVEGLGVSFPDADGKRVEVVRGISFSLAAGELVGLIGESGCGKTMTGLAILDLLPKGGRRSRGRIRLEGIEVSRGQDAFQRARGRFVGLIPQEVSSALNPVLRLGSQLIETLRVVRGLGRAAARREALALLDRVAMPDAAARLRAYPHELSGGQRQRAMIAIALAAKPRVLIADESTTALDVTVQAQILTLLDDLRRDLDLAILLITHDLSVVASTCERALVMYAGEVVEAAPIARLFARPSHPYTAALLGARPRLGDEEMPVAIEGTVPDPSSLGSGCAFAPRCPLAEIRCGEPPPWRRAGQGHGYRCIRADEPIEQPASP